MTPLAVFVRTLLKTSAVFIGVTTVMLHPSFEWSRASGLSTSSTRVVTARQSPAEAAVDALVAALKDTDAGVRRQAAAALGDIGNARAVHGIDRRAEGRRPRRASACAVGARRDR